MRLIYQTEPANTATHWFAYFIEDETYLPKCLTFSRSHLCIWYGFESFDLSPFYYCCHFQFSLFLFLLLIRPGLLQSITNFVLVIRNIRCFSNITEYLMFLLVNIQYFWSVYVNKSKSIRFFPIILSTEFSLLKKKKNVW